jgi:hypothetical protein
MTWIKPEFEVIDLCSEVTSYLYKREERRPTAGGAPGAARGPLGMICPFRPCER